MNIAIVGAGNGGTKLLDLFTQMPGITVTCIVDREHSAPGMERARVLNVHAETDLTKIPRGTQIIIEATGNQYVLDTLKSHYSQSAKIVESDVAAMMMLVVDRQIDTADQLSRQLMQIQSTSDQLTDQMQRIVGVTNQLESINTALLKASEQSQQFIHQSNQMTTAINQIANQIKILGINANIEAARAGEHGRGFSVVATEVQKLSDSTGQFANQISQLLTALSAENDQINKDVHSLDGIATSQSDITQEAMRTVQHLKNSI